MDVTDFQIFIDFQNLNDLRPGVRDHEMAGTMDVASLLQDIQSKQDWQQNGTNQSELSDR